MADKREFLFSFLGKETVSPAADKAERAIGDLGDQMSDTQRDAKALDDQIDQVEKSLRELAQQYTRTGDDKFVAQIRQQERELRKLNKVKVHLGDLVDTDEATKVGVGIAARIGPAIITNLPKAMSSGGGLAGAAVVGTLAAELAVVLGGAVAGGIVGGAGVGGVVGGLSVAARHSAVQSAAAALGHEISGQLEESAVSFVPAAIDGIGVLRTEFGKMRGDIDGIFADSAKFVRPLAEGAGEGVREIVAGVRSLTRVATPAVLALSEGFGELGGAVRDGLESLTDNADSGARALTVFFEIVEFGVRSVFGLINILAELYEVMEFGNGLLEWLGRSQKKHVESNTELGGSLADLMKGFEGTAGAVETVVHEYRSLAEVVDDIIGKNLSLAEAEVAAQQGIVDTMKAIKENGKTRNEASQAYRDNQVELLRLVDLLNQESAAADESGRTSAQAAALHKQHADALYAAARAAGRTDAEAKELIKTWLRVPKNVSTTVSANTKSAQSKLNTVHNTLRALDGYVANASVYVSAYNKNAGPMDQREYGGPVTAGHAYIVGEKRAEVFVPDQDGTILPSVDEYNQRSGYAAAMETPGQQSTGAERLMLDITIRWPDGQVAERIVAKGIGGRSALSAVQRALRTTPGVRLRTVT